MKVLFVCLANEGRSPYAERYFRERCREKGIDVEVTSAGLRAEDEFSRPVTRSLVESSDLIFVMEEYMKEELIERFYADPRKICCLNVPNRSNSAELIRERLEFFVYLFEILKEGLR